MTKPNMRLALRAEGNYWNAYVAEMGTMEGAVLIGSISLTAATDTAIYRAFMALMQKTCETLLPIPVEGWDLPRSAPEHERSGRA